MRNLLGRIILKCIPPNILKGKIDRIYELNWLQVATRLKKAGINSKVTGHFIVKNPQYISIGDNFSSMYNLRIEAWDAFGEDRFVPQIIIGDNVICNSDCHIGCINKIVIGNNVLMASRIYITDHFHGEIDTKSLSRPPASRQLVSKGPVFIEDNVWIGENVVIMPNVTIGKNAIIGANAVVTKDIPANAVAAGIPAKVLRILE